jgi:hypothetical protein
MKVIEATVQDKQLWDSFVDENDGDFMHYFDWKNIYELDTRSSNQTAALIIKADNDRWTGICHLTRINQTFYSKLVIYAAPGILFRKGLSQAESAEATSVLVDNIRRNYSSRCSALTILELSDLFSQKTGNYNKTLLEKGFRVNPSGVPGLPCAQVLPVEPPFEENIWERLWSGTLKQKIRKVEKSGVRVIQDREFKYFDTFLDMITANYKRYYAKPPNRDWMTAELDAFKNKTKLFVALEGDRPIITNLCHYTNTTCFLWEIGSYTKDTNNVNTYCYKTVIEDACNSGYRYVHFGRSYAEGLARYKDVYKGTRMPVIEYEIKYSSIRKLIEKAQGMMGLTLFGMVRTLHDGTYLWGKRNVIWSKLFHRQTGIS